jgi:hypothetical protein
MGLMKFSATGIGWLRSVYHEAKQDGEIRGKPPENAYMTDLPQTMIDKGFPVRGGSIDSPWVEVDTVADKESSVTAERLRTIERSI